METRDLLYKEVTDLLIPGVYVLENQTDHKAYIGYSVCILKSLVNVLDSIKTLKSKYKALIEDKDKLIIKVLDTSSDRLERLLKYNYWVDRYRNNGYSMYREFIPIQIRVDIVPDPHKQCVYVTLVTKGFMKTLVGVFSNMEEAGNFVRDNYSIPFFKITYAQNDLTNQYLKV